MAKTKLYPPQLEGSLPAFYKRYNEDNELTGAIINIPFGVNRAVSMSSVGGLAIKIRTTSTNTYLINDYKAIQFDPESNMASFEFKYDNDRQKNLALLFNEGQYYRVQLAFIDKNGEPGYYSTVGIIKCVAPPLEDGVIIEGYQKDSINSLKGTITGVYTQNTYYGDTTEKVYSYRFDIYGADGTLYETSEELIHDVTQDVASDTSSDRWRVFNSYPVGEVLNIQYTVTTLNGLVISSPMYRISKTVSVDPEFPIYIHATPNFDNGYIDITLSGKLETDGAVQIYKPVTENERYDETISYLVKQEDGSYISFQSTEAEWNFLVSRGLIYTIAQSTTYGEQSCSGYFLITRASSQDKFFTWVDIERFVMVSDFPSSFHFIDKTVEQGIEYKYAIQQYNVHGLESNKIYQTDNNGIENTVIADFEDMFLSDGQRQLRIRFNPKVTSFKSTIPEQKIETIGSKYPFIFRNGSVCYKEFPIAGLISYQMDEATMFLNEEELEQAGIMENTRFRRVSNYDSYIDAKGHEIHFKLEERTIPIYDKYTGIKLYDKNYAIGIKLSEKEWIKKDDQSYSASALTYEGGSDNEEIKNKVVRMDKNLTTENLQGERYFKLKVLDWLNNGKVKLFRSPAEGNYLVRLLNVSLSPTDALGRMLHSFTCTGYEIADLTYENLVSLGLITESTSVRYEEQWATVDMGELIKNETPDEDGFITISPVGITINGISIQDFAPGDQIKINYDNGDEVIYVIGVTGSLDLTSDDRSIIQVSFKPNPDVYGDFERNFVYQTTSMTKTKFDAIRDVLMRTVVAEQFVGPQDNLLEPFILRDVAYGVRDENGLVLDPATKEAGYEAIYNDLKAHHRFNYYLDNYQGTITEKFTGLKMDYLHVVKRNIIPIFCYDAEVTATSKFGVTPFGRGYVNNQPLTDYLDFEQNVQYSAPVVGEENGLHYINDGVNIYDIDTLLQTNGLMQHPFDILKVFIYNSSTKQWEPIKDGESYQYFDCYTKQWWEPGVTYDPSFSINELDPFPERTSEGERIPLNEYIGDNNIYLNDIEELTLYNIGEVKQIRLGNGVVAEISMQMRVVDYDIEESDEDVRLAKLEYLNAKDRFEDTLDKVMENADYYTTIQEEYKKYAELYDRVLGQLNTLGQTMSTTGRVFEAAERRTIQQKQQLWTTLQNQLNSIVSILKTIKIYTAITQIEADKIPIIGNDSPFDRQTIDGIISAIGGTVIADPSISNFYSTTPKPESIDSNVNSLNLFKRFLEQRKHGKKYSANGVEDIESLFSEKSNYIMMSKENDSKVQVKKPDGTLVENKTIKPGTPEDQKYYFDKVNSFFYIYTKLLEAQIEEEKNNIADYDAKIKVLEAQCGELVGGYLSEYDETNPPPDNTIVYYDYQLQLKENEINALFETYNTERENLIDKLLLLIFAEDADLLTGFTDDYIQDNAEALIELLTSTDETKLGRIPQRERELKELQDKFYPSIACLIFDLKDANGNLKENIVTDIQKKDVASIFTGTIPSLKQVVKNAETDDEEIVYVDSTESQIYTAIKNRMEDPDLTLETLYNNYIKAYEENKEQFPNPVKSFLLDTFVTINAYCAAYDLYINNITQSLNTMNQQLLILQQIVVDPGSISRAYGSIIEQYSADGVAQLKTTTDEIKDTYITDTSGTVNEHFAEQRDEQGNRIITKSFEDLANIKPDASRDDKASIILNLLLDQYNRKQANEVTTYLNQYTKESGSTNDDTSATLMAQLKNIEYVYQNRLVTLNNEKEELLRQKNNYEKELENLKQNITTFEQDKIASEERLKDAQDMKSYNEITEKAHVQESEELIDDIIRDSAHQFNVSVLKDYIEWILWIQDSLQKQIGQIYAGIEDGNGYAEVMKKYINLYEAEAFEFLHWFDALPEDLDDGFDGVGGLDEKFKNPETFFFKDYKDILYLSAPTKNSENSSLDKTANSDKVIRNEGYAELKDFLINIFTYHKKDENNNLTEKRVGLVVPTVISPNDPEGLEICPELLEFRTPGADSLATQYNLQEYYPDMYLFGTDNLFYSSDVEFENREQRVLRLRGNSDSKKIIPLKYLYDEEGNVIPFDNDDQKPMYDIVPFDGGKYRLLRANEIEVTSDTEILIVNGSNQSSMIYRNRKNQEFLEIFNKAIYDAIAEGYRVVWETPEKPLEVKYQPYDILYPLNEVKRPTESSYSLSQYISPDSVKDQAHLIHGKTCIQVTYNNNFDEALGLLIYDYNSTTNSYQNCIASLRAIDKEIRENLSSYFLAYFGLYLAEQSNSLQKLLSIQTNISIADMALKEAQTLVSQCELVDKTQQAANLPDTDLERQQLLYLLESAREDVNNYQMQKAYWKAQLEELLMNAPELTYYQLYAKILPELERKYANSIDKFNTEYDEMQKKLEHYLNLLFNNEPYGKKINEDILQHQALLETEGNTEGMYNFGIAYALEKFKDGITQGDNPISFGAILNSKTEVNKILQEHFNPFNKVIPTYIETEDRKRLTTSYLSNSMFYKNPTTHKYEKYFKINDEQWEQDLLDGRIYSTKYPALNSVLNVFHFETIPPEILFDEKECYYLYDSATDSYTEAKDITAENFSILKNNLYWKNRNGGLLGILNNLTAGQNSPYIQEIKEAYLGSLKLYQTLQEQSLGDESTRNELEALLNEYEVKRNGLKQILDQFDGNSNFDNEGGLNTIIEKLAEFLRALTVAYVTKVERSYGVI